MTITKKKSTWQILYLSTNHVLESWNGFYKYKSSIEEFLRDNHKKFDTDIHICRSFYTYVDKNDIENTTSIDIDIFIRANGFIYVRENKICGISGEIVKSKHTYHISLRSVVQYLISRYENRQYKIDYKEKILLEYKNVFLLLDTDGTLTFRRLVSGMLKFKSLTID